MKQKKKNMKYIKIAYLETTARRFESIKQNTFKRFPRGVDQLSRVFPLMKGKVVGVDLVGFNELNSSWNLRF